MLAADETAGERGVTGKVDFLKRRAGLLLSPTALRSERDCGVGDLGAMPSLFSWMEEAGLSVLQLLPLNDLPPDGACPYSGVSAFALDPVLVALENVPEIRDSPALAGDVERWRASPAGVAARRRRRADFATVRAFKLRMLEHAFALFRERQDPARAKEFQAFREREADWLGDYALFRAIKALRDWETWREWPAGLRDRDPQELAAFAERHGEMIAFFEFLQWIVHGQWQAVRRSAAERGILLFGDIPFGLNFEAADIWARAAEFDLNASMGAPPDQFSETGQAWGLPAYRWAAMEAGGHAWWRSRARRAAELYDLFRIDHVIGVFRTWVIPDGGQAGRFDLPDEGQARARGERFLRMIVEESGRARPVAEDLGVIPPWAREVLQSLGVPGYKVARWERRNDGYWHPRDFPPLTVANLSNHDTSTLAGWWGEISPLERERYWEMVTARRETPPRFGPPAQETLLANLYEAGSALVVVPFQDAVRSRARVNVPGTVNGRNWTYRIPWNVESLAQARRARDGAALLRRLAETTGRRA
ncbi:MAG TPA: 4-alpha-glucanotransferase [Elusimicrobiota bacterium]|nr:4-alpha-glucanotransferase [Elusimicrobiota bacterium]